MSCTFYYPPLMLARSLQHQRDPSFPPLTHTDGVCTQVRQRLPRRHQPDLVADVRHGQHLRGLPATAPTLSEPDGSTQRRGSCADDARAEGLRGEGQGYDNSSLHVEKPANSL